MEPNAVLLVEDSPDDRYFFERAYRKTGWNQPLVVAEDGDEALRLFAPQEASADLPLIVFLDLKLPKLGGIEVLAGIRKADPHRKVIVICLTGSKEPLDRRLAYEGGANGYLMKPQTVEEIDSLLGSVKRFWIDHNITPRSNLVPRVGEN